VKGKERALAAAARENPATPEDPYSKEEIEDLVTEAALPELRSMTAELAELGAPEGDEKTVETIVGKFETGIQETEADPTKFLEGNPFLPADNAAQAYGLRFCIV